MENVFWENPHMSSKPLETPYREQLTELLMGKKGLSTAREWGIDRGTLAEAALGLPKQEGTRLLIKTKLRERKMPI